MFYNIQMVPLTPKSTHSHWVFDGNPLSFNLICHHVTWQWLHVWPRQNHRADFSLGTTADVLSHFQNTTEKEWYQYLPRDRRGVRECEMRFVTGIRGETRQETRDGCLFISGAVPLLGPPGIVVQIPVPPRSKAVTPDQWLALISFSFVTGDMRIMTYSAHWQQLLSLTAEVINKLLFAGLIF